jgi:type VI secretion system protein ImpK
MRDDMADLVHPVFNYGLKLKDRLERGERCDLLTEQSALKALLQTEMQARKLADFGADGLDQTSLGAARMTDVGRRTVSPEVFLGVRYALACWLDEIFILDTPWSVEWNERKIEEAMYGTNDRAWKFWEQARRAEARPGTDALEVYYLCVMLGFRGDLREEPDKLSGWVKATSGAIGKGQGQEFPVPPELEPQVNVPPLRGRERLQRMILFAGILLTLVAPIITFLLVFQLRK